MMEYVNLGRTGVKVSRICLGAWGFGNEAEWMINKEQARPIIKRAMDLGVNFFDTADSYSQGLSEEILGEILSPYRSDVILATKVGLSFGHGPNSEGLSRSRIQKQLAGSLSRLRTQYIDLFQMHRWDYSVPIEEILSAMTDSIKMGKVTYLGVSSMYAWQLSHMIDTAASKGFESPVSIQPRYNLIYREEEREMIPLCRELGLGIIPYSPLARGFLTGKYKINSNPDRPRYRSDKTLQSHYSSEVDHEIVETVLELSKEKGVEPSQISLAWLYNKPWITSPIIGVTKVGHVDKAVEALDVKLGSDDIKRLEEGYTPHPVFWQQELNSNIPDWFHNQG